MDHRAWKRERYEYLTKWLPILERLNTKFPVRRASFEEIEQATGVKFLPDLWKVVNELRFPGGMSNGIFEWQPEADHRIEILNAELKKLQEDFDRKSWIKRLNLSAKVWDIIKIGLSGLAGYIIGKLS